MDQRFDETRRRRYGIPRHDGDAVEHRAEGAGGIPVDENLARGLVHPLHAHRIRLFQVLLGIFEADVDRFDVELDRFGFRFELLRDRVLNLLAFDREQMTDDPHVDHVREQFPEPRLVDHVFGELGEGHWVEDQIVPNLVEPETLLIDNGGAGIQRLHVLARGLRVHRDQQVDVAFSRDVAVLARTDGEPRRKTLNVRREQVFTADGNTHLENGAHQYTVRRLAPRSVDGGDLDRKVVDDARLDVGLRLVYDGLG